MTLYEILGVSKDATKAEIKVAYRELSKTCHPDTATPDEEKFKAITNAYEVLSDDVRRAKYDLDGSTDKDQTFQKEFIDFIAAKVITRLEKADDPNFDMMTEIREEVEGLIELGHDNIETMRGKMKKLQTSSDRISKEGEGENLILIVVLGRIGSYEKKIEHVEGEIKFAEKILQELSNYSYLFTPEIEELNPFQKAAQEMAERFGLGPVTFIPDFDK